MVKNRVHALLDRYELNHGFSDLFGARGRRWLKGLRLPGSDGLILKLALAEIDKLDALVEEVSRAIAREAVKDSRVELLLGFKGIDYYTAMIIVNEIGDINRFSSPRKLAGWAGLCLVFVSPAVGVGWAGLRSRGTSGFVGLWFRLLIRLLGMMVG